VLLSFFLARWVLAFIQAPVQRQLQAYWERYYYNKVIELQGMPTEKGQASQTMPLSIYMPALREELGLAPKAEVALNPVPAFEKMFEELGVAGLVDSRKLSNTDWASFPVRFGDSRYAAPEFLKLLKEAQPVGLTTLSVQEAFVVYFKVALMTGFVLGSPWIFYKLWAFVAAGLYPHEKKWVHMVLPFSIILFLGGVALCEFVVMDKAVEALLWFNEFLGMTPDLRLNEWLGFAIIMPVIFGLSFQTPLVMLFLQRVGVITVDGYRRNRRLTWFLMAAFAAVITPSTDPVSMTLLWLPMCLLYELGIWLCQFVPGEPLLDLGAPEPEEMVEV
jgi:Tat protein translocase TatC